MKTAAQLKGKATEDKVLALAEKWFGPYVREAFVGDRMRVDAVFPRTQVILEIKSTSTSKLGYVRRGKNELLAYAAELTARNMLAGRWLAVLGTPSEAQYRILQDGIPQGHSWGRLTGKTWGADLVSSDFDNTPLREPELQLWRSHSEQHDPRRSVVTANNGRKK